MNRNAMGKFGAVCAVLVGVAYFIIGVIQLVLPEDQTCGCADRFWLSYLNDPFALTAQYIAFALSGIFGIAAVTRITDALGAQEGGWLHWTRQLAILGFALTAIDNFHALDLNYDSAFEYVNTLAAKAPLSVPAAMTGLDVNGWFRFGAIGLWVLAVSLLALRSNAWPRLLAYLGIALAVAYFLLLASNVFDLGGLTLIVAGVGGLLLAPIWYIGLGLKLYDVV